jgi:hypothetical protein
MFINKKLSHKFKDGQTAGMSKKDQCKFCENWSKEIEAMSDQMVHITYSAIGHI